MCRSSPIFELSKSETDEWRKKIRDDASQFFQFCKQIDAVPDVVALTEWCQYLAPACATTRFDTIFYTVILPTALSCSIAADDDETISADVSSAMCYDTYEPMVCFAFLVARA